MEILRTVKTTFILNTRRVRFYTYTSYNVYRRKYFIKIFITSI